MVYRPTVRYADVYKKYIDDLFQATTLDRNQIIRAALFTSAFSDEFQKLVNTYKKKDVPIPSPKWSCEQHELWMEQNPVIKKGGKDVHANGISETKEARSEEQTVRSEKEVPERRKTLQPEGEKNRRQAEERRHKKEALDTTRAQQGPTRPICTRNQGGITIRIG